MGERIYQASLIRYWHRYARRALLLRISCYRKWSSASCLGILVPRRERGARIDDEVLHVQLRRLLVLEMGDGAGAGRSDVQDVEVRCNGLDLVNAAY
jgi:hypothetical protein